MDYCLFKLRFDGAVHFGQSDSALSLYTSADHFYADTFFSALCHTAGTLYGEAGIERLCARAQAGELLLSDSMPWRERNGNDIYYLPKPCAISARKQEIPAHLRKAIKKLAWIPVQDMGAFERSMRGEQLYLPEEEAFGVMENARLLLSTMARTLCLIRWVRIPFSRLADCTLSLVARRRHSKRSLHS